MEWVEVQAKTVAEAVDVAIAELGISSSEDAVIDVIQEPKGGFLGIGGQNAIVKVQPKPKAGRGKRRRRGRGGSSASGRQDDGGGRGRGGESQTRSDGRSAKEAGGDRNQAKSAPRGGQQTGRNQKKNQQRNRDGGDNRTSGENRSNKPRQRDRKEKVVDVSIDEQAEVAKTFLVGLLDAFGLEGKVETRIDDDVLYLDVIGDQTEALVGSKGSIMHSVLELTRTVVQRRTHGAPRMRIDIAGYAEQRREALKIYTAKLVDRLKENGGEVMLEPMNAADRKVVHDAVAELGGVKSFSEGEEPNRAVVLAAEAPPSRDDDDMADDDDMVDDDE